MQGVRSAETGTYTEYVRIWSTDQRSNRDAEQVFGGVKMIEGYEVPVHRSLSDVILLGGVPRTPAILLWTTATALGFGMQQIWVVPIAMALHMLLATLTRKDPFFFDVFLRALKSPKILYP